MSRNERAPLLGGNIQDYGNGGYRPIEAPTTCGIPRNFANVTTMAFAFLCLFSAFQTTQTLAGAVLGNLGTIAFGTLYCFFVGCGFVAPVIARSLGPIKGMVFGGCTYIIFVASYVYMIAPIVIACGALVGLGAAVLWCSQGLMITQCTNETNKATYSSYFWGIFNLAVIPGNVLGHFLLEKGRTHGYDANSTALSDFSDSDMYSSGGSGSDSTGHAAKVEWYDFPLVDGWTAGVSPLFLALGCMGLVGTFCFLFIRAPDANNGTPPEPLDPRPICQQVLATVALMLRPRMMLLLPIFLFSGVEITMWSAWFTRQMYKTEIGFVLVGFGLAEFAGGMIMGKIADSCGRWAILLPAGGVFGAAMWLTWTGNQQILRECKYVPCDDSTKHIPDMSCPCDSADYTKYYIAAVLYGLADCAIQTATSAICATDFVKEGLSADAFALFRTFQSLGLFIGFGISPVLGIPNGAGGTTSTIAQLRLEMELTAGCGILALVGLMIYSAGGSTDK